MVRRSSLIIAASLAVLSTFEPGALCFAAAAPAAVPRADDVDRFERPKFLKRQIHRYVFVNTTTPAVPVVIPDTTTQSSTPLDTFTTTSAPSQTAQTPDEIAASLSAVSLASAKASWASAHPGVEFGASLPGPTTATTPPTSPLTNSPTTDNGASPSPGNGNINTSPNGAGQSPTPTDHPIIPIASESTGSSGRGGQSTGGNNGQSPTNNPGGQQSPTDHPIIPIASESTGSSGRGGQSTGGSNGAGSDTGSSTGGGILGGLTSTGPNGLPIPLPTSLGVSVSIGGGASPAPSAPTAVPVTGTNSGAGSPVVTPGTHPTDTSGLSSVPGFSLGGLTDTATPLQPISIPTSNSLLNALTSALATGNNQPAQTTLSNGAVVPIPVPTGLSVGASVGPSGVPVGGGNPASIVSNGQTIANPSFIQPPADSRLLPSATQPGVSVTLPTASLIPNPSASAVQQSSGQPASITLPNGSVVPNTNTGSMPTQSSGALVIPGQSSVLSGGSQSQSSGAPAVLGSTTNSNGQLVPISSGQSGQSVSGSQSSASQQSGSQPSGSAVASSGLSSGLGASQSVGSQPSASPGSQSPAVVGSPTGNSGAPSPTPPGVAASPPTSLLPIATNSQSYNTQQNGPLTQRPTGYDSMTSQSVPSSILLMPSSSSPSGSSYSGTPGLPTGVPLVLYPPTGPVNRPENTDLIQIGFLFPLNYDFVWMHEESQRQIFKYLPIGLAFGLEIENVNVTMQTLRAWDTTQDLHYITTLALAWIPSNLVDSLGLILHTQAEKFYHNPDPAVRTLLSMINPALPIRADNATDGGSQTAFGASPTATGTTNNGAPIGNGINNSSPVKASSVGIGVGVVCGAAAYGAAMFFVARRYKKRRQSHLRSPSMYSSPVMSHTGPDPAAGAALMSGGMGERSMSPYYDNDRGPSRGSGRSGSSAGRQQISAPVMAENSLGWN